MALMLAFQFMDFVTTYIGIAVFGGRELHPFLAWLIALDRWDLVLFGKMAGCVFLYYAPIWLGTPKSWRKTYVRAATALGAFACVWNSIGLLLVMTR